MFQVRLAFSKRLLEWFLQKNQVKSSKRRISPEEDKKQTYLIIQLKFIIFSNPCLLLALCRKNPCAFLDSAYLFLSDCLNRFQKNILLTFYLTLEQFNSLPKILCFYMIITEFVCYILQCFLVIVNRFCVFTGTFPSISNRTGYFRQHDPCISE